MKGSNHFEKFQSAYSVGRSTETTPLRVPNGILMLIGHHEITCLIVLDLSTALDTLNNAMFLESLGKTAYLSAIQNIVLNRVTHVSCTIHPVKDWRR